MKQGYKAIKMQVAHVHTLAQDLENVRRMREAVGPDIDIMIDVNMGWSADVAIEMGRKFEQYGIYWLEEPVPADDFAGYQRIAAALDMRVVGGETHFTRYDLRPFFINPCLPILQPDPMRGGMTDLRKIATLADTWGITIAPHLFPELNVHLLASIPNGIWAENMGLLDDLWVDPPEIANGMITAPERPGHGLRFKDEVRKGFCRSHNDVTGVKRSRRGVRRSDDRTAPVESYDKTRPCVSRSLCVSVAALCRAGTGAAGRPRQTGCRPSRHSAAEDGRRPRTPARRLQCGPAPTGMPRSAVDRASSPFGHGGYSSRQRGDSAPLRHLLELLAQQPGEAEERDQHHDADAR